MGEQVYLHHILQSPNGPMKSIDLLKRSIPVSHCISSILGGLAVALRFLYLTKSLHPKHSDIVKSKFMASWNKVCQLISSAKMQDKPLSGKPSDTVCISLRPLTSKFGFGFGQVQVGEGHEGRGGDAGAGTASETCGTSL